jgi:hypothetical protein
MQMLDILVDKVRILKKTLNYFHFAVLARVWGDRHFHTCLIGTRIGIIFTESNLAICIKNLNL